MSVFIVEGLVDPKNGNTKKAKRKYLTKYNAKYQVEYPWALPSSKGDLHSYCDLCDVHICIKSVGAKGLRDHEATCRHSQKAHQLGLKPAMAPTMMPMMNLPPSTNNPHQRFGNPGGFIPADGTSGVTQVMPRPNGGGGILQQNEMMYSTDPNQFSSQHQFNGQIVMNRNQQMQNPTNIINPSHMTSSSMYVPSMMPVESMEMGGCKTTPIVSGTLAPAFESHFNAHNKDGTTYVGVPNPQQSIPFHQKKVPVLQSVEYQQMAPSYMTSTSMSNVKNEKKKTSPKFPDENVPTMEANYNSVPQEAANENQHWDAKPQNSLNENVSVDDLTCNICEQVFVSWKELKTHLLNHIKNAQKMQATTSKAQNSTKKKDKTAAKGKKGETPAMSAKEKRKRGRPFKTVETPPNESASISSDVIQPSYSPTVDEVVKSRKRGRPSKSAAKEEEQPVALPEDTFTVADEEYWVETLELEPQQEPPQSQQTSLAQNALPPHSTSTAEAPAMMAPESLFAPSRRSGQLQCRVCKRIFYQRDDLQNHYKTDHNNGKPFECNVCNRFFTTKNHLEVHQKHRHNPGPDPCRCTECGKVLSSRTNLKIHRKLHTGEKPFSCPICNKSFSRKANMEMHKVYHTGERRFICEVCGQSFFAINALRRHKKLHTGERDYACDVCGATYVTGTDLRRHKLKHADVKPFPCTVCERQFARAHDLKVHMRYHNKELRFQCGVCGREFVESGNFKRHMRRHTGERPYQCKVCQQTFAQVHHYKIHVQNSHPDYEEEEASSSRDHLCKTRSRNSKMAPAASSTAPPNPPLASIPPNPPMNPVSAEPPIVHPHHSQANPPPPGGFLQYNSYVYSSSGGIQQYPNLFDMCSQPQQQPPNNTHISSHYVKS